MASRTCSRVFTFPFGRLQTSARAIPVVRGWIVKPSEFPNCIINAYKINFPTIFPTSLFSSLLYSSRFVLYHLDLFYIISFLLSRVFLSSRISLTFGDCTRCLTQILLVHRSVQVEPIKLNTKFLYNFAKQIRKILNYQSRKIVKWSHTIQ